jgi:hypothetical protein
MEKSFSVGLLKLLHFPYPNTSRKTLASKRQYRGNSRAASVNTSRHPKKMKSGEHFEMIAEALQGLDKK